MENPLIVRPAVYQPEDGTQEDKNDGSVNIQGSRQQFVKAYFVTTETQPLHVPL